MPKAASEEVHKALDDVRDAARAVLTLPTRSAELVNALHHLVARAAKAAAAALLALPGPELAPAHARGNAGARACKTGRPWRKARSWKGAAAPNGDRGDTYVR